MVNHMISHDPSFYDSDHRYTIPEGNLFVTLTYCGWASEILHHPPYKLETLLNNGIFLMGCASHHSSTGADFATTVFSRFKQVI